MWIIIILTAFDVKKLREEQKNTQVAVNRIQEHMGSLAKQLQDMQEKTFAIPGSEFQVIMSTI